VQIDLKRTGAHMDVAEIETDGPLTDVHNAVFGHIIEAHNHGDEPDPDNLLTEIAKASTETIKLWHLHRVNSVDGDRGELLEIVVRAVAEADARRIAATTARAEGSNVWWDPQLSHADIIGYAVTGAEDRLARGVVVADIYEED
jgi:hypothetical protein